VVPSTGAKHEERARRNVVAASLVQTAEQRGSFALHETYAGVTDQRNSRAQSGDGCLKGPAPAGRGPSKFGRPPAGYSDSRNIINCLRCVNDKWAKAIVTASASPWWASIAANMVKAEPS
jgi:hypothetical protein